MSLEPIEMMQSIALRDAFFHYLKEHGKEVKWQWLCEWEFTDEYKFGRLCHAEDRSKIMRVKLETDRMLAMLDLHREDGFLHCIREVCEALLEELNEIFEGQSIRILDIKLSEPVITTPLFVDNDLPEHQVRTKQFIFIKYRTRI